MNADVFPGLHVEVAFEGGSGGTVGEVAVAAGQRFVVAEEIALRAAGTVRVLPLRLGWKAVAPAGFLGQPLHVRVGAVPADARRRLEWAGGLQRRRCDVLTGHVDEATL